MKFRFVIALGALVGCGIVQGDPDPDVIQYFKECSEEFEITMDKLGDMLDINVDDDASENLKVYANDILFITSLDTHTLPSINSASTDVCKTKLAFSLAGG